MFTRAQTKVDQSAEAVCLVLLQAKSEVQKLIVKAQDGALEAQPGRTIMESFEGQVMFTPQLSSYLQSRDWQPGSEPCMYQALNLHRAQATACHRHVDGQSSAHHSNASGPDCSASKGTFVVFAVKAHSTCG